MSSALEPIGTFLKDELFRTICGRQIGDGTARAVYEHALDPTLVIKFEADSGSFQNVTEWQTWHAVKDTKYAKWFAPCVSISPNGAVLVMRRTTPAAVHPDYIPSFFTDTKCANFGMLIVKKGEEPQFVCHDYGVHLLLETGMSSRMRKANWWNV